jgi:hypothetical protein
VKPEELLDPTKLPDDLRWLATHYRLQPDDPVFLLVAWHWHRVSACEDTIRAALAEMKAALDARLATMNEAAEVVGGVTRALGEVQQGLEQLPAEWNRRLEADLQTPFGKVVHELKTLEHALRPVAHHFQVAQRRHVLAALLVGLSIGILGAVIVLGV